MTILILCSEAQVMGISPFFPLSHGLLRIDDLRVIGGIIFAISSGLRGRDVRESYGPHKTNFNRFIRWSKMRVLGRIIFEFAKGRGDTEEIIIHVTHFRAQWTAASLPIEDAFARYIGRTRGGLSYSPTSGF